jgi:predicted nuclease of predicted toxin-antitoxin system
VKVLLDACVWGGAREELETRGHEVVWAGDWDEDPGDEEILNRACAEGHVLVTIDKDFGELAVVRGVRHAGIIRLVGFTARRQAAVGAEILQRHGTELSAGALVTVSPGRVRVRPGPGRGDVD